MGHAHDRWGTRRYTNPLNWQSRHAPQIHTPSSLSDYSQSFHTETIHTSHATSAFQRCYLLAVVMNELWENVLWIYIKTAIFIQLCVHLIPIQLCEISHIWHTAYQTKLENLPILMLCGILLFDQWCLSNLVLKLHQIWKFENQFYNWTTEPLSALGHLDSLNLTGLSRLKSQSHKSFVSLNDHFVRSQTWLRISSTVMFFSDWRGLCCTWIDVP